MPKVGALLRSPASIAAALSLALAACVSPQRPSCRPGEQLVVQDTLYFGTMRAGGPVTADDWAKFLNTTVTPRFPQGLTVSQASGQWRGADGAMVRESTYVLTLLHPDGAPGEAAIAEIVASYKSAFQQESVLRSRAATCATF
ncbi:MAG TPA: DUF3574 domain-containing protein [Steroidobacteraceae bacterium]|nr:DUF3574 domain-containing protein [Steroidobacteraceae bacterium]